LGWSAWCVLALIQVHSLCSSPTWSISSAIVFARLEDSKTQFGPLRAMATIGWMAGCLLVSALNADTSTIAGYSGSITWLALCAFTFLLRDSPNQKSTEKVTLRQRLGWDALSLLKHPDHRAVFIMVGLFAIPLAAFYPYTPPHLRDVGLQRTSAWMTLGQITEIICMFSLGTLLTRFRLKWIFATGLAFGVVRFAFSAVNTKTWLLTGVFLHGASFTLVYITAQIYLDQRVESSWRTRAQALMALVNGGVGNLLGYLGVGWWFLACARGAITRWSLFWSGLAIAAAAVLVYFLATYKGRFRQFSVTNPSFVVAQSEK
jgi:hypothetical protein